MPLLSNPLDYADIIYDQPNNINICNKIESLQYIATLPITGAIRGLSKEKLYKELAFEYFSSTRLRKLCLFYKIVVNKSRSYLYYYISTVNQSYQTRSGDKFLHVCCTTEYFVNFFILYTIKEWNNLVRKFVNQYHMRFLDIHYWNLQDLLPIACLMFLIVLELNFLLDYV